MAKHLKAEMWDRFQYTFRHYYDRTMHDVLVYDRHLDEELLKKIFLSVFEQIPVLRSTFNANFIHPFWKVNEDIKPEDFFTLIETDDEQKTIQEEVVESANHKNKTQLKVKLIRSKDRDVLICLFNHMCFDGGDLKYLNGKIAEAYTALSRGEDYVLDIKKGTRSAEQVYSGFSEEDKKQAKKLYHNISVIKDKVKFPYEKPSKSDKSRLVVRRIDAETFVKAKAKGKEMGITVNDLFLAAYARSLFKICGLKETDVINIMNMIDCRKYIPGGQTLGMTNCTGYMPCSLANGVGDSFIQTIENVSKALEPQKTDKFNGLYSLPLLKLNYTLFIQGIAEILILLFYDNPLTGMSNVGKIVPSELGMGEAKLVDAFYTGTVKYKPYIQLSMTTMENVVTMITASRCSENDAIKIGQMLDSIVEEIKTFAQD